jgi:hypothetical protein
MVCGITLSKLVRCLVTSRSSSDNFWWLMLTAFFVLLGMISGAIIMSGGPMSFDLLEALEQGDRMVQSSPTRRYLR